MSAKKNIALLVENDYQDQEVWYPYYRLKEEGFTVVTVGTRAAEVYKSKHGYPVTAQLGPEAVAVEEFDAVVIPGGWAPDRLRQNAQLVEFVRGMFTAEKVVAAICHAGWMLVSAGILKGKRATSFIAIKDDMRAAGCTWTDEETVVDGNLITARRPDDLPSFVRAIIDTLRTRK